MVMAASVHQNNFSDISPSDTGKGFYDAARLVYGRAREQAVGREMEF